MPEDTEQAQEEDVATSQPENPPLPHELPEILTLSNGIKVRVKRFPRALLRSALSAFPDPEVPTIEFEDGSTEENPNDPDFHAAWEKVHEDRLEAAARVTLGYGLDVDLESLPEDVYGPQDEQWIQDMESIGIDVGDVSSPFKRQFAWLNLYAIPNEEERTLIFLAAQNAAGVIESEVVRAMRFFQDLGARRARDKRTASASAEGSEGPGDPVREGDPVAGKRVRGKRRRKG
jgi:hypothetical protein